MIKEEVNKKSGYIYIYKCAVGGVNDIVKIGKTEHIKDNYDRVNQHRRTPYYCFVPYLDFLSGKPIYTAFKVSDMDDADNKIKECFKDKQLSNLEIYNMDYDYAIKKIYDILKENKFYMGYIGDNYSNYDEILGKSEKINKKEFESIRDEILNKYKDNLPEGIHNMLRDKKTFKEHCNSHYIRGNYIDFADELVLDLNFNRDKRRDILNTLKNFI